jgi:hypothetical protein
MNLNDLRIISERLTLTVMQQNWPDACKELDRLQQLTREIDSYIARKRDEAARNAGKV